MFNHSHHLTNTASIHTPSKCSCMTYMHRKPWRRWQNNIKLVTEEETGYENGIDIAQDRGRWRVLVNTVMNFRAEKLLVYQQGLCSMMLSSTYVGKYTDTHIYIYYI
jgi:hypothetical protein